MLQSFISFPKKKNEISIKFVWSYSTNFFRYFFFVFFLLHSSFIYQFDVSLTVVQYTYRSKCIMITEYKSYSIENWTIHECTRVSESHSVHIDFRKFGNINVISKQCVSFFRMFCSSFVPWTRSFISLRSRGWMKEKCKKRTNVNCFEV